MNAARRTEPLLKKLRKAKDLGIGRAEAGELLNGGARNAAAEEGWPPAMLAAQLAYFDKLLNQVYGEPHP